MKKALRYFLISWTMAMLYLLLTPGSVYEGNLFFEGEDKIVHFVLFSTWSFCVCYLQFRKSDWPFSKIAWLVFASGALFAGLTEILQIFVPYRTEDFGDFFADLFGTTIGIIVVFLLKKELIRIEKKFE